MGMHELDVQIEGIGVHCPDFLVCRVPLQSAGRMRCESCGG
jgi:hypothetical protein